MNDQAAQNNVVKGKEYKDSYSHIFNGSAITSHLIGKIAQKGWDKLFDMVNNDAETLATLGLFSDKEQVLDVICRLIVEVGAITSGLNITPEEIQMGMAEAIFEVDNDVKGIAPVDESEEDAAEDKLGVTTLDDILPDGTVILAV